MDGFFDRFALVLGVLLFNAAWMWWRAEDIRLGATWPVAFGGFAGLAFLALAAPGRSPAYAVATVVIVQLMAVSSVEDACSRRLPLPVTKLLYIQLLTAALWAARSGWLGWEIDFVSGVLIWVLAFSPGVIIGGVGLGDLLIAPALGGWVAVTGGPSTSFVALLVAMVLAAAEGSHTGNRVALGPWMYLASLTTAGIAVAGLGELWTGNA